MYAIDIFIDYCFVIGTLRTFLNLQILFPQKSSAFIRIVFQSSLSPKLAQSVEICSIFVSEKFLEKIGYTCLNW